MLRTFVLLAFAGCSDSASPQVSSDRAMTTVEQMVELGERAPGSNEPVAMWLRDRFEEVGVEDVTIETFPIPVYETRSSVVRVSEPASAAGELTHLTNQFGGTGSASGELVDMSNGRRVVEAADGQIALIDALQTASIRVQYGNAIESGADAVVFNSNVSGGHLRQRHIWRFERKGSVTGPIPAVSIAKDEALQLRDALEAGETISMQVEVQADVERGEGHTVVARIPGTEFPDRRVLVNAHIDSWFTGAVDNAQGTAALVELAHVFANREPRYTMEIVGFDVEETGLLGSATYLRRRMASDRDRYVAAITLEMLAPQDPDLTIVSVDPLQRDAPDAVWNGVLEDSGLAELFETRLGASDLRAAFNGEVPLDQKNFWEVGIPGFFLVTTYEPFHTELDTMEIVDRERFGEALDSVADAIVRLQDIPPDELGIPPASWLEIQLSDMEATMGTPPSGTLQVELDREPVSQADLIVTAYDESGFAIVGEADVTERDDGMWDFTFRDMLPPGVYVLNVSAVGDLTSGRNWFPFEVSE